MEARETEMRENLIPEARRLQARAMGILDTAEKAGRLETALRGIRELRGILELLGKLNRELEERGPAVQRIEVTYVDKALIMPGANPAPVTVERALPGPVEGN